ncbi:glycosyltransferase [Cavenderia fasciculata]|uniref:dolichyl-P-Man:Man5GlcNAc2-PP-dolichol alpha-1,3-mannosyltransferase n=1 Tax=Cavenderia fasciculata TaxID=261658 RepID=F4QBL4_CACFS|nr:glycosyltransferase [Cavenderia fasciculata]EGG14602.1 glycosyltransferase [Cavenderia fasciculata]|eukprot:XP_004351110.1 glycosyltransferase [Cavenderia fasciculata]
MSTPKKKSSLSSSTSSSSSGSSSQNKQGGGIISKIISVVTNQNNVLPIALILFLGEIALNYLIVTKRAYTNIDWEAYMEQIDLFVNGERNYMKLEGGTGPVVYPAGYIYVYTALYWLTNLGQDIRVAQWIFVALYLTLTLVVFFIYNRSKSVPAYALTFLCISIRVHSIFSLRLFNDGIAMLLFYVALLLIINYRWSFGCLFFSLAVSIKMNVLLYAPALLLLLVQTFGFLGAIPKLVLCAVVQVVLAAPFLLYNPESYLNRAFEFSRQFLFKWTVNWRFIPEDIFLSKPFALGLLTIHLLLLVIFLLFKWTRPEGLFKSIRFGEWRNVGERKLNVRYMLLVMFTSNLIGVTFARSLHYQFYVWYYHTIPFLLWQTRLPVVVRVAIIGAIEYCWYKYPSTNLSSGLLLVCNLVIIFSLLFLSSINEKFVVDQKKKQK